MSARAAWRLESLGFSQVLRYTDGKMDWFAHGLPIEGKSADQPRAGTQADPNVPTCGLNDSIGAVRKYTREADWGVCVVVNEEQVVLGMVWGDGLEANDHVCAEDVMDCAPPTVRPHVSLERAAELAGAVDGVLVTTSDGVLLGMLHLEHHDH